MQNFNLLADRIRYLMDHFGLSQTKLGEKAGVKPSSVNAWLTGKTKQLKGDTALLLSRNIGVSYEWLVNGTGAPELRPVAALEEGETPDQEGYVEIPFYEELEFACGNGSTPTYEQEHDITRLSFRRSWFQKHHLNPDKCMSAVVVGDSMEPCLHAGDVVVIDGNDTERIANGHVYAILLNDELLIKRLYRNLKGDITIHSDNADKFPEDTLMHDDESNVFRIIGRVVNKSGNGGL